MEKYLPLSYEIRYVTRNKHKVLVIIVMITMIEVFGIGASATLQSLLIATIFGLVCASTVLFGHWDRYYLNSDIHCKIPKSIVVHKVVFRHDYENCFWIEKYYEGEADLVQEKKMKSMGMGTKHGFLVIRMNRGLYCLESTDINELGNFTQYLINKGFNIENLGVIEGV